jgi:hypothetical protein
MDDEFLPLTDAEDAAEAAETEQENIASDETDELTESPEPSEPPKKPEKPKKAEKAEKQPTRGSRVLRRVLAGILTLLLVVLALLVFVFRDELTGAGLRRIFGVGEPAAAREAFTYETGAMQVFAPAGDGLAVASGSSVQLLNAAGETVFKQVISYDAPAVFASEKGALFCDLGGTGCILADFEGNERNPSSGAEIQTAGMNEDGWFYIVTAESGYKGLVSVYNSACEKQYEWWSGSGYVLRAAISPDDRSLAVLCVEQEGAKLHFFALNSETERGSATVADTLLIDLCWLGPDSVCAVGETGVWFYAGDGTEKGVYALDGRYLLDYEFGRAGFAAIFVSAYRSGAGGTLLTLDARGQTLGSAELDRDVISLSAVGKQVLAMTGDCLALYSQDLTRQSANETLMTAKRAILRPAGDILLLHAYSAERFSF